MDTKKIQYNLMHRTDFLKGWTYEFKHHDGSKTKWRFEGHKKRGTKWTCLITGAVSYSIPEHYSYAMVSA